MVTYIKRGRWRYLVSSCTSCGVAKNTRVDKVKEGTNTLCRKCAMGTRPASIYARGTDSPNYKHGKTNSELHKRWQAIRNRVKDPAKRKSYLDKGILVCQEWSDFTNFEKWALENGYRKELTIDRIDNDGNYEPGNCRWVTHKVNSNNRN